MAGKRCSKTSSFSNGAWCWANGMQPESNHTSITSGTRCIGSPQSAQSHVGASTNGRCGSSSMSPDFSASSVSDPMHSAWPLAQRHTGSGVPQ